MFLLLPISTPRMIEPTVTASFEFEFNTTAGQLFGVIVRIIQGKPQTFGPFVYATNVPNAQHFAISWDTSGDLRKRQNPWAPKGKPAVFFFGPTHDVLRTTLNVLEPPTVHARVPGGPVGGAFGRSNKDRDVVYVVTKSGGVFKTSIKIVTAAVVKRGEAWRA